MRTHENQLRPVSLRSPEEASPNAAAREGATAVTTGVPGVNGAAPQPQLGDAFGQAGGVPRELTGEHAAPEHVVAPPPSFELDGEPVVFGDIQRTDVDLTFDVKSRSSTATATVELEMTEAGYPILDLVPNVTSIKVNGKELPPEAYETVTDPDGTSKLRVLREKLEPGTHVIELTYAANEDVEFTPDGVNFETEMDDLAPRKFLEQYFPASYEFDQHPMNIDLKIVGASREHRIMSNAAVTDHGDGSFSLNFPSYFTASSHFIHVIDPAEYHIVEHTFEGIEGPIKLVIYGRDQREVDRAISQTMATLKELEDDYGPYAHPSFVAHVGGRMDGMEYAGATQTSLWALEHEITHSWFARGVFPASGNDGWMDEAIASWRDNGYPRASSVHTGGNYPPMASFSDWRRDSPEVAYSHGARMMSELDYMLRDSGGLKPVLRDFYDEYRLQVVDTEMFLGYLQDRIPEDLSSYFVEKVYGGEEPGARARPSELEPVSDWFHSLRRRPSVLRPDQG